MNLNSIAKPVCSVVLSGIFISVAFMSLSPELDDAFATPDFTPDDNTNSLLEGIGPFDNTTSSNVSSSDITSSGGDDTTSSGGDDTTSSGGDDTTSSGGDDTTSSGGDDTTSSGGGGEGGTGPIQFGSPPAENKLKINSDKLDLHLDESFTSSKGLTITKRGGTIIDAKPGGGAGGARCHDDEIAVGGGYFIDPSNAPFTIIAQYASNQEGFHGWYVSFTNPNKDTIHLTAYVECLK